ncbi:hypothetical protein ACFPRL_06515 [Pseudoclavibacter helvolus]
MRTLAATATSAAQRSAGRLKRTRFSSQVNGVRALRRASEELMGGAFRADRSRITSGCGSVRALETYR